MVKEAMEKALNLAKDIPEPYNEVAFKIIFERLIDEYNPVSEKITNKKKVMAKPSRRKETDINEILHSDFDWPSTNIPKLKPIGQNLYVLKIAKEDFGRDELTPREIQVILSQKFRLTKSANAISMSLMTAVGKYVDRVQMGKEFAYRITNKGKEYLSELIKEDE